MKLLTTILLATFTTSAFAAVEENVVIVKRSPETIYQNSSEHNRLGKNVSITAQILGVGPSVNTSSGLTFGYHLDRNKLIQIEAMTGNTKYGFLGSNYEVGTQSAGVHFKHFVGNSFYYRTGVDHRKVDYKYLYSSSWLGSTGNYDSTRDFSGTSTGATLVIGNQWQWENFTMGCDWIGYTAPFASQITSQSLGGNVDSFDRNRLKSDQDRLLKDGQAHALRFFMGVVF